MPMLSEDDTDLTELSAEELDAAWDLWFDLAQATNDADPPCDLQHREPIAADPYVPARWAMAVDPVVALRTE